MVHTFLFNLQRMINQTFGTEKTQPPSTFWLSLAKIIRLIIYLQEPLEVTMIQVFSKKHIYIAGLTMDGTFHFKMQSFWLIVLMRWVPLTSFDNFNMSSYWTSIGHRSENIQYVDFTNPFWDDSGNKFCIIILHGFWKYFKN